MTTQQTDPPRHLGRYELVHLLGQGGMGEVYLAKISGAAGFEKPCIVKTILPALLKDNQFLDRFHHEAKVLVHLVHSSIAQVYDMGEANGTYYMALEYVAGVDVAYLAEQSRTQGQAIPVPVALYIGQKVAEGLGYAHRKAGPDGSPLGIVHRDVSPHNVMVSYEGEVKVIDFGLAKSAARSKYTLPSTVMGKLGYMSPEQARAEPLDHRSDIYSAGVMIWELLAGRQLVAHGTVGEMMAAMANPHVPALHELRPDVDPAIDAVVRRALASNPQDRYGRADELARALNEQLLRSSSSLGAEEVGNFVKGLCPEAFSAQRKLISRISGVRRSPSTPPNTGVMPAASAAPVMGREPITGLEATSLRPLSEMQTTGETVSIRPMATPLPGASMSGSQPAGAGPLVAAPMMSAPHPASQSGAVAHAGFSKSKLVGIALVLVVMMIGTAGTTVYLMGAQGTESTPVAQHPQGYPPPHGAPPHPPLHGAPPPPPPHGAPPHPPPHGAPPPPPPHGGQMAGPPEGAAPAEGLPQGSPATAVVPASGSEGATGAAPAVGTVGSVAVAPAVVQVPGGAGEDSSTRKEQPKRPRSRESEPAELLTVKQVKPLIQRGGTYGVPAGAIVGLKKNMVLKVVGPELEGGKRKLLGYVTVDEVKPVRSRLLPDNATIASREARFVVLPEAEELAAPPEAPPSPPEAAAPPPPRKLALGVKDVSTLGLGFAGKGYIINSAENEPLNNCKVTVERGLRYRFPSLSRGENKVGRDAFRALPGIPPVRKGWMRIECDEGKEELEIR